MPRFTTTIEIPSTPGAVFAYIVTPSNWSSFRGLGPLPGIASARTLDGGAVTLHSRVRVTNTDGSEHDEIVRTFEPPRRYGVRIEPGAAASRWMAFIDEDIELEAAATGTRMIRRIAVRSRAWFTAPVVLLVVRMLLRPAIRRHDLAVARELAARG